jgi:hypothetical protein
MAIGAALVAAGALVALRLLERLPARPPPPRAAQDA